MEVNNRKNPQGYHQSLFAQITTLVLIAFSCLPCSCTKPDTEGGGEKKSTVVLLDLSSDFFSRHKDKSGVVSYILRNDVVGRDNTQSNYFNSRSITDDGRFMFFYVTDNEFANSSVNRSGYILDLKERKLTPVPTNAYSWNPQMDAVTDVFYYCANDKKSARFYKRELLNDTATDIALAEFPKAMTPNSNDRIHRPNSHISLTSDKQWTFIDARVSDRFYQGMLNLYTGEWKEWDHGDINLTHAFVNPKDDKLVLLAQDSFTDSNGVTHAIENDPDGTFPRIQLMTAKGRRTLKPDPEYNYATHESWDDSGEWVVWCSRGIHMRNIFSDEYKKIYDGYAAHCMLSKNHKYVVFDDNSPDYYRGCRWKVGFHNCVTGKTVYIHSDLPAIASKNNPSTIHPDPHPQFVCNDEYIVCTMSKEDGNIYVSITPVSQLRALTSL